jgi:hypothetical protein
MTPPRTRHLLLLTALVSVQLFADSDQVDIRPLKLIATTAHEPIDEMSGLVKSRRFADVYWVHNDSADIPRLFAINRSGQVIITDYLKPYFHGETFEAGKESWPGNGVLLAVNEDWEDIAIDDDQIYIADIGNNGNARRDMGIYILNEPNPHAVRESRIINYLPIQYPEQEQFPATEWHYDSEAIFISNGKLYFLTKHRQPNKHDSWEAGTNLYRLDSSKTTEANTLVKVDSHSRVTLATGSDVSPDGTKLAIATYTALWVFDKPADSDKWLSGRSRTLPLDYSVTRQIEAVCWDDNETLLISNEQREIYEVKLDDIPDTQI